MPVAKYPPFVVREEYEHFKAFGWTLERIAAHLGMEPEVLTKTLAQPLTKPLHGHGTR